MEIQLQTEKIPIDSEFEIVGTVMQFHQATLEEELARVHILQELDNQIVGEATELFAGIRDELEAQSKQSADNSLQVFPVRTSVQAVQKTIGILSNSIYEVNKVIAAITTLVKNLPSKRK
jgi:hypothetical protein